MRFVIVIGLSFVCSGCVDLSAVQTFSKMAPDPTAIQGLTRVYSQELDVREDIKLLGDEPSDPSLAAQDQVRAEQATAIQGLDTSLREYMQALGALAGGDVVQSSSNVKDVASGLTSLQKAAPILGITDAQISIIGNFIQSIADLAENGYRNAELAKIIRHSDPAFQQIIRLQSDIVSKAIRPSIGEIGRSLNHYAHLTAPNAQTDVQKFIGEDLEYWRGDAIEKEKKRSLPPPYASRNPTYGIVGAADAHVARYLLKKSLESDQAALAAQSAAADAYVKSLQSIGKAHATLVKHGKGVLTKETAEEIKPLAQEVYKNYQGIRQMESNAGSN